MQLIKKVITGIFSRGGGGKELEGVNICSFSISLLNGADAFVLNIKKDP